MSSAAPSHQTLVFDQAVYRLSAIKSAAYKFGDRCFVHIRISDSGLVEVQLQSKPGGADLAEISGLLQNEVLDQELRAIVEAETADIRRLLLAHAFAGTNLVDPQGETADYRLDPLGIRNPDHTDLELGSSNK